MNRVWRPSQSSTIRTRKRLYYARVPSLYDLTGTRELPPRSHHPPPDPSSSGKVPSRSHERTRLHVLRIANALSPDPVYRRWLQSPGENGTKRKSRVIHSIERER